jgi:hypothetical protein
MTIKLNEGQLILINALKETRDWMTQAQLAGALHKNDLTVDELMELDRLGDLGLLVKETSDDKSPEGLGVRYRYTEPKVEDPVNRLEH